MMSTLSIFHYEDIFYRAITRLALEEAYANAEPTLEQFISKSESFFARSDHSSIHAEIFANYIQMARDFASLYQNHYPTSSPRKLIAATFGIVTTASIQGQYDAATLIHGTAEELSIFSCDFDGMAMGTQDNQKIDIFRAWESACNYAKMDLEEMGDNFCTPLYELLDSLSEPKRAHQPTV
jgi:hypothetical protein